jgi:tRNA A-37 threonylcarbamoyl transferase component Bud32
MPVSVRSGIRPVRSIGTCWIRPDRRNLFESLGIHAARDFLALSGVVVSGHVGRNVSRVELGGTTAYLKREHRVRLRDRFRSWCDSFGWASISLREAKVIARLEQLGLPGPKKLAAGEYGGQGFLLVEAADEAAELCSLSPIDVHLAERLGRIIARLHAAGIDQPDLFAKHILVRSRDLAITILDWQRAILGRSVSWRNRILALATLRESVSTEVIPGAAWDRLLTSYISEVGRDRSSTRIPSGFCESVSVAAKKLLERRGVRSMRIMPGVPVTQELVRISGETVCAIPEVAPALANEHQITGLYNPDNNGRAISLPGGRTGLLRVRRYALPFGRWWSTLRGRPWRSLELKAARLLFHLERHGIAAPKLFAYGQVTPSATSARSFLLSESVNADAVGPDRAASILELLDRVHAAGCGLSDNVSGCNPFGLIDGRVAICNFDGVRLVKRRTRRLIERDRARVDAFLKGPR